MKSRPKNKGKKFVPHQKKRKLSVVSPEVLFAQKLAANDPVQRNRAVKKLQKWLQLRGSLLTKEEIMRIWKGLHYCFWMSDKPLIQEELAETIGIVLFLIYQLKFISPLCVNVLQLKAIQAISMTVQRGNATSILQYNGHPWTPKKN